MSVELKTRRGPLARREDVHVSEEDLTRIVGQRLRRSRLERNKTLEQVATAAGITRAFLSQVERGESSVSLASLLRICNALSITVGSLFERPKAVEPLRLNDRVPTYLGGHGVVDYILTSDSETRVQVLEAHVSPKGASGEDYYTVDADLQFMLVTRGSIEVDVQGRGATVLEQGDATCWSPRHPYRWRNPSSRGSAVVIFVVVPAVY